MAQQKRGLVARLLIGSEKTEGYARAHLPSNRWELGWDIFKGSFWKLVLLNIIMVLFFAPLIALFFYSNLNIASLSARAPFAQGFGVGYQMATSLTGYAENIVLSSHLSIYIALPVAFSIAALGLAGGTYVMRNMVWTEGVFVAHDFWTGIRKNFVSCLWICALYSIIFYAFSLSVDVCNRALVTETAPRWLLIISLILSYTFMGLWTIMSLHMITMNVNYKVTVMQSIKNAVVFTVAFLPHSIFMIVIAVAPIILIIFGGLLATIGYMLFLFFYFATALLVWSNFCQWIYDNYVNGKIVKAPVNRGIYEKVKPDDTSLNQYKKQKKAGLSAKPVKPITDEELQLAELPTTFRREDIEKLNESRQAIIDDNNQYLEEHKDEFEPDEETKEFLQQKKAREDKIARAAKELEKRQKNKQKHK